MTESQRKTYIYTSTNGTVHVPRGYSIDWRSLARVPAASAAEGRDVGSADQACFIRATKAGGVSARKSDVLGRSFLETRRAMFPMLGSLPEASCQALPRPVRRHHRTIPKAYLSRHRAWVAFVRMGC